MARRAKRYAREQPDVRATDSQTVRDSPGADARLRAGSPLNDYFAGLKGELTQIDRLVGDAAGNLAGSFRCISRLTRARRDIAPATENAAASADNDSTHTAIADQIEQELEAAMTALQFGDLVTQLLGHTMLRVEALSAALQGIDWHDTLARAALAANAATRSKPVVQQGMQTGDVELF